MFDIVGQGVAALFACGVIIILGLHKGLSRSSIFIICGGMILGITLSRILIPQLPWSFTIANGVYVFVFGLVLTLAVRNKQ